MHVTKSTHSARAGLRTEIGKRLRKARKGRGISARDLAAALDIRASALGQMELGRQAIPAELLSDWCRALDICLQFSTHGLEGIPVSLPPHHAHLFSALTSEYRQVVLDTLESVARLAQADDFSPTVK